MELVAEGASARTMQHKLTLCAHTLGTLKNLLKQKLQPRHKCRPHNLPQAELQEDRQWPASNASERPSDAEVARSSCRLQDRTKGIQAQNREASRGWAPHLLDDAPAQHLPGVLHNRRADFLAPAALFVRRRRSLAGAALLAAAAAVLLLFPAAPVLARGLGAAVADVHVEGQPPEAGDHQQRQRDVEQQPAAGLCGAAA